MKEDNLQKWQVTSYLTGNNADYIEALYENYLHDPQSVAPNWRHYFAELSNNGQDVSHADIRDHFQQLAKHGLAMPFVAAQTTTVTLDVQKQIKVLQLIDAYRTYGHYHADLDPLNLVSKPAMPELELDYFGLQNDPNENFDANGACGLYQAPLKEIVEALKQTYCRSIGFEYKHISHREQVAWLQQRIETNRARPNFSLEYKRRILEQLTRAEGLERYLGAKYVGAKRFSLEGGDSLIPMLDQIVQQIGNHTVKEIIIGMAHRGRLNVLVNILGKAPAALFQEFEGKFHNKQTGSGDVKYHNGFSSDVKTQEGSVHLTVAFNPSHLEIIDPVVEGSARARQQRRKDLERKQVIPILIHGDSAFAGQGVVMETFALSQTRGYATGGTLHIVVNNQIGFTTSDPLDMRSSWYCTDVAKMIEAPIFHVNGDDPEAVLFVAQLALDFRVTFNRDVVIDLICYRRHGHNEADEPSATQPTMYQVIKQLPTVRKQYADQLIKANVITEQEADVFITKYRDALDTSKEIVDLTNGKFHDHYAVDWTPYLNQDWTAPAKTNVPVKQLKELAAAIEKMPEGMQLQPQVAKMMEERRKISASEVPMNWGYAEVLAYASLLAEGYPIRISGQDSGRGTFAHRHSVLRDYKTGDVYVPLEHVAPNQAHFVVVDSLLSESAVLGFEYGYATASPDALVIWEAQFGDFANGAQVVIDQFISSGEQKWGKLCGLVMFLPHGYEGQGPEHSSARMERYLQLCAQHNMQVCVPTTPAQTFHMLRRQMLRPFRKPLIVMTPKSLLRHKLATSNLQELADGQFQVVISEVDEIKPSDVRRVILCCGKIYYELLEARRANKQKDIAIIRVEQLYPFPKDELTEVLQRYKKTKEIIWCQEEPKNQGAWYATQHNLLACLNKNQTLDYIGRKASAAPAVGSHHLHEEEQKTVVVEALS